MNIVSISTAALVAAAVLALPAAATEPTRSAGEMRVAQADCHADVRRHYVERYGERVWHYHRGDCRAVRVDPPGSRGSDRDGGRDGGERDCHRDVRTHYLREYGDRVAHRHVGDSCRVRVYERDDGRGGGRNCVQIGPIRYCEG